MVLLETSGPSIGELENVAAPWHEVKVSPALFLMSRIFGMNSVFFGRFRFNFGKLTSLGLFWTFLDQYWKLFDHIYQ